MTDIHPIAARIIAWYSTHCRDLPWRHTKDPYKIWLSEVILHQTRVSQGLPYYFKFLENYPNVQMLAEAPEEEVMRLWQGLGYYSRALNMHKTAQQVVSKYNGVFPSEPTELAKLHGIGPYTTAAIASFAFDKPLAVVDGNVMRVLSRLFAVEEPVDSSKGKKMIENLAYSLLPTPMPAIFNQAIMEFGALQCVPINPDCKACVLADECLAFKKGIVQRIPMKRKAKNKRLRQFTYFIIVNEHKVWMQKRTKGDIWAGLYEFYLQEMDIALDSDEGLLQEIIKKSNNAQTQNHSMSDDLFSIKFFDEVKHVLTHQLICARFFVVEPGSFIFLRGDGGWFTFAEADRLPKPILIAKVLNKFLVENNNK